MAYSQKMPILVPLSKQIYRHDTDIIAIRQNKPLYADALRSKVALIHQHLVLSSATCWAIAMQDSFNFVAGLLALLYSGKHPILLNPQHRDMASYYQALLTDNNNFDFDHLSNHDVININQLSKDNSYRFSPTSFESDALTLFTSGSTGLPKPIQKTVMQLEKESEILTYHYGLFSQKLFIASVAHDHMYGLTFKIMLALSNQVPFVCEPILYQEMLTQYSGKNSIYITTPAIIKTLDPNAKKVSCDKVFSAGGPLSYLEAHLSLQCLGALPHEIYGSSETGVIATRIQNNSNTPWQLFSKMKVQFIQKAPFLTSPLLRQKEPLADKIAMIDTNKFFLNGRLDKIIKISEQRVSLTYVEDQLNQLSEINKINVIPLILAKRTILAAVVRLSDEGRQKQQQLGNFQLSQYFRQQLKDKLSLVTIPKKWRFVDQFPINSQGKSTYIELKSLFDNLE